jgi:hypothetical protein
LTPEASGRTFPTDNYILSLKIFLLGIFGFVDPTGGRPP